jgi:predicted peptidase
MKMKRIFTLAGLAFLSACATGPRRVTGTGEQPAHADFVITENISLDYLVHLPSDSAGQPGKKWPAIIFLHGSGERGTNVWDVAKHGPPKLVKAGTNFPFIVLSPQCPPGDQWQPDAIAAFVNLMKRRYPVDPDRVYLTGLSMGGTGTWNTLLKHPELFAAAVPICGRADTNGLPYLSAEKLAALKHVPIRIFHGAKDPEVPVKYSKQMTDALEKLGANVKLTIYPEALHDSWSQTYTNQELYSWLLSHDRKAIAQKPN